MIHLLNVGNVRDLGGWDCDGGRVKYGLLFRGGEMYGYLTDDGRQQAIDMLGILKEIDLRFAAELNGRTESGFGPTVDMLWVSEVKREYQGDLRPALRLCHRKQADILPLLCGRRSNGRGRSAVRSDTWGITIRL